MADKVITLDKEEVCVVNRITEQKTMNDWLDGEFVEDYKKDKFGSK